MINSYIKAWFKIFDFSGKTSRKDYWYFLIINFLVTLLIPICKLFIESFSYSTGFSLVASFFLYSNSIKVINSVYLIGNTIVSFSILIRRLRDIGKSWQWLLVFLIPIIGQLLLIYWVSLPSKALDKFNKFKILESLGFKKLSLILRRKSMSKKIDSRKCKQCGALIKRYDLLACEYCGYEN